MPGYRARPRRLALEQVGQGDTVVLIHGLATTRAIWDGVIPALARTRHVVALDVPGFGASPPAGPAFDLEVVAERIARSLAAQGVRGPFDVVGHSLGAGIALTLATIRPNVVRRLVLVAPAGFTATPRAVTAMMAGGVEGVLALRRGLALLSDLRWGRRLLLMLAAADGAQIPPSQARQMVRASAGATRIGPAFAAIASADLTPLVSGLAAPLGLIWGERDRTVSPRIAERLTSVRPDVRLELVPGAGHVVMVERPREFVVALERLLDPGGDTSQTRNISVRSVS